MPSVAEMVRRYGPAYLERFGATMPAAHQKVLRDIAACRTGELGTVLYRCEDCGRTHAMGRSCGNRHCPSCQRDKAEAWLADQTERLLPCPYFLVTFTLPAGLRDVARVISGWSTRRCSRPRARHCAPWHRTRSSSARTGWDSSASCTPGAGRWNIIPMSTTSCPVAGSAATAIAGWRRAPTSWCRSRHCRSSTAPSSATCLRAGLLEQVAPSVWDQDWVVHCQPAGDGRESLRYLAPYVFRVAIGDHRIVSCDDGRVTFTYRRVGSNGVGR